MFLSEPRSLQYSVITKTRSVNCEHINDLGITVNSEFTPSASVRTAANKVRGMLYFIERSFTCLTNWIFVHLYSALVRPPPQKGHIPPRKKTTGSNEVGARS